MSDFAVRLASIFFFCFKLTRRRYSTVFWKFNFRRHYELIRSGQVGSVFCLWSAGRIGNLAGDGIRSQKILVDISGMFKCAIRTRYVLLISTTLFAVCVTDCGHRTATSMVTATFLAASTLVLWLLYVAVKTDVRSSTVLQTRTRR